MVRYCILTGIFAIGYAKPDNKVAGKKNRKTDIIASCCVADTVDIKSPAPSVVNK